MTTGPVDETGALVWDEAGAPRSRRFGDIYFSQEDGLQESRTVFLDGCGLPDAWRGRAHFTVAELGFGTGLNIAALLDLWRRERPQNGHLHIFSIEAFPIGRQDAERALSAWPEIAEATQALLAVWPAQARGFRRVQLAALNATLDLAVMEAAEALERWTGQADAWFLDGFAPSANPQMWREEVLGLMAARSAPDVRLATFTVAGAVRRGLQAQGLAVEKRPGHGRKRERLEARGLGSSDRSEALPTVAVIGAGIAGAALARSLRTVGCRPTVISSEAAAPAASRNPAALVSPRLDAGGGVIAVLSAQAFRYASDLYRMSPAAIIAQGALQLEASPRDAGRFDALAQGADYSDCGLERLDASAAADRLNETSPIGGLWLHDAVAVEPASVLSDWLHGCEMIDARAAALRWSEDGWQVLDDQDGEIALVDRVIVATGADMPRLTGLHVQPVRGQVSFARTGEGVTAAAWGGYAIPWREGVLFGATHDRDDDGLDIRPADHDRNLVELAARRPRLAARLRSALLEGRAGVRASSRDRLPLAGAAPSLPGVFVLGGLGGRGFTFAPLLADHVAALACGLPSPLPVGVQAVVDPDRFRGRQQRREQGR